MTGGWAYGQGTEKLGGQQGAGQGQQSNEVGKQGKAAGLGDVTQMA